MLRKDDRMIFRLTAATLALCAASAAFAQSKGTVNVYNWSDYIAEDTIAKFEAETGIKVVYDVYDSNEVLEAKLLAGSSGYDLVVPTSSFLQRQIGAGVYQPLNKDLLPNLKNMDPDLMERAAAYDPGNEHSVVYMWGTVGIGYNVEAVRERLGEDVPVDSWSIIFDPEIASKFADCGLTLLDSKTDMLETALNYLGFDPNSKDADELEKAKDLLLGIRPYVRYFSSSQYISDLANGEVCMSVGFSGDIFIAADRAVEAGNGIEIGYSIPKEGGQQWFDMMAIPADAPNPEAAHAFMNFVMEPQIAADITNYVFYANANAASTDLINPEITGDPAVYPDAETIGRMWAPKPFSEEQDRAMTRAWQEIKSG